MAAEEPKMAVGVDDGMSFRASTHVFRRVTLVVPDRPRPFYPDIFLVWHAMSVGPL